MPGDAEIEAAADSLQRFSGLSRYYTRLAARWHLAEVARLTQEREDALSCAGNNLKAGLKMLAERDAARAELERVGKQAEAAFEANLEARAELAAERKKLANRGEAKP